MSWQRTFKNFLDGLTARGRRVPSNTALHVEALEDRVVPAVWRGFTADGGFATVVEERIDATRFKIADIRINDTSAGGLLTGLFLPGSEIGDPIRTPSVTQEPFSGTSWTVVAPGGGTSDNRSNFFDLQVTSQGSILSPTQLTFTYTLTRINISTREELTYTETLNLEALRQDVQVKLPHEPVTAFRGTGVLEATPAAQVLEQTADANGRIAFHVRVTNTNSYPDKFFLAARAETNLRVATSPVLAQLDSSFAFSLRAGEAKLFQMGVSEPPLQPGQSAEFFVRLERNTVTDPPPSLLLSSAFFDERGDTFTSVDFGDQVKFAAFDTFRLKEEQVTGQPDLLIKRRDLANFVGNGVLEPVVVTQRAGNVSSDREAVTFDLRLRNSGDAAATFKVAANFFEHDDANFTYLYRRSNGDDVTAAIRSTGLELALNAGGAADLELIITPRANAPIGTVTRVPVFVVDDGLEALDEVSAEVRVGLVVNTARDLDDADLFDDGVLDVDPNTAGDQLSLRAALRIANARPDKDTILFNLPPGETIINVGATGLGALPAVLHETLLDGLSQPGDGLVELHGRQAGAEEHGLTLRGERITVKGFDINNFGGHGFFIERGSDHVISDNFIGSLIIPVEAGDPDRRNGLDGIHVEGAGQNVQIRDNRIHGNRRFGIDLSGGSGTTVLRNEIMRNPLGGVHISESPRNVVSENVVSLNGDVASSFGAGINVSGPDAANNVISNNTVGLDKQRALGLGNLHHGIVLSAAGANNTIDGNVIADNLGIGLVLKLTDGTNVFNNTFGFAAPAGAENFANFEGAILIDQGRDNHIGAAGKGNQLFGHGAAAPDTTPPAERDGIRITGARSTGNKVQGNRVGTNTLGIATTVGHQGNGVVITNGASINTIGGAATGEGNLIVHSGKNGVLIAAAAFDNKVLGNLIGTNGTEDHGNRGDGVRLDGANDNLIGGPDTSLFRGDARLARTPEGNVISGNDGNGVQVSGGSGNKIQSSIIGLNAAQDAALANGGNGVLVNAGASDTLIGLKVDDSLVGDGATGSGNLISGNTEAGVRVEGADTTGTRIAGNQIGSTIGIAAAGVTPAQVANRVGVFVGDRAKATTIGERGVGRNLIRDNRVSGIEIVDVAGATANQVAVTIQNNVIRAGRGATDAAIAQTGILLDRARDVVIGATLDAALFAADLGAGLGNDISENAAGIVVVQSQASFVSKNIVIARNELDGNRGHAVALAGKNTAEVRIFGNLIGAVLANRGDGVHIEDASNSLIQENKIESNETGVRISRTGADNRLARFNGILGNTFRDNRRLAIDLVVPNEPEIFDGVSFNDATDLDEGPNDLQNFVVDNASTASLFKGRTLIGVALKTEPLARYRVEFFAVPTSQANDSGDSNGEAARFLGERSVTTNNLGAAAVHFLTTAALTLGSSLTATVTRIRTVDGQTRFETSEFSNNFTVVAGVDRNNNGVQDAEDDLGTRPPETNGRPISEVTNVARVLVEPVGTQTSDELDLVTLFVRPGVDIVDFNAFRQTRRFDNREQDVAFIDYRLDNVDVGEKIRVKTTLLLPGFLGTVIAFKADSEGSPVLDAQGAPLVFSGDDVLVTEVFGSAEIIVEILVEDGGPLDQDGQRDGKITDPVGIMAVDPTDLSATLTGAAAATVGVNQTLTLTVSNINPDTAANAVVAEVTLPPGVEFIEASDGGTFDAQSRVVTFRLGDVAGGATLLRTVTVRPTAAGTVAFSADVAIKGLGIDLNAANDVVEQNVAVSGSVLTAQRVGKKLIVTGTAFADAFELALAKKQVTLTPLPGTAIDGDTQPVVFTDVGGVKVLAEGGDDTIRVVGRRFKGKVVLNGGTGDDRYVVGSRGATIVIKDPDGRDRVGFSLADFGVVLDLRLDQGQLQVIDATGNTLSLQGRIERATGSPHNDRIAGAQGTHQLTSGGGVDELLLLPEVSPSFLIPWPHQLLDGFFARPSG